LIAKATGQPISPNTWILDSGATSHVSYQKSLFTNLTPCDIQLHWGQAEGIRVKYIGDISLKFTSTGQLVRLTNCLYAPELGMNLISTGKLIEKGITVISSPKDCRLTVRNKDVATGSYEGGLTLFYTENRVESANLSLEDKLWHERMGHIGGKALTQLVNKTEGIIKGTPGTITEVTGTFQCETCIQAKATAIISRELSDRAQDYLDKVHSDICGPITPETFSKARYFASIIDDKTRWAEAPLLRSRDQVYNEIAKWLTREEN
jgi:hypothetical protein